MSHVSIRNLRKQYGDNAAVADFSLEIGEGEFVAFLGPSGCGKTTTLRMVAGFVQPSSGEIVVNGRDITYLPPHVRNTGMVFQRYALFPHMTVQQNVAFGLEMRRLPAGERDTRVRQALDMVRLSSPRIATRARCRAGNSSAWRLHGLSRSGRTCSCSTNPCPTSTPS
jgi:putative spermidine/putrescine transport system ATP-binding protein